MSDGRDVRGARPSPRPQVASPRGAARPVPEELDAPARGDGGDREGGEAAPALPREPARKREH